ncbi:Protein of unknown function [Gryllus bimaculatus]|nr:Protein of unknown function [Gryllus bimaculatus]
MYLAAQSLEVLVYFKIVRQMQRLQETHPSAAERQHREEETRRNLWRGQTPLPFPECGEHQTEQPVEHGARVQTTPTTPTALRRGRAVGLEDRQRELVGRLALALPPAAPAAAPAASRLMRRSGAQWRFSSSSWSPSASSWPPASLKDAAAKGDGPPGPPTGSRPWRSSAAT